MHDQLPSLLWLTIMLPYLLPRYVPFVMILAACELPLEGLAPDQPRSPGITTLRPVHCVRSRVRMSGAICRHARCASRKVADVSTSRTAARHDSGTRQAFSRRPYGSLASRSTHFAQIYGPGLRVLQEMQGTVGSAVAGLPLETGDPAVWKIAILKKRRNRKIS
jgi:hypothetical protein